jgi:hypothetical protein
MCQICCTVLTCCKLLIILKDENCCLGTLSDVSVLHGRANVLHIMETAKKVLEQTVTRVIDSNVKEHNLH